MKLKKTSIRLIQLPRKVELILYLLKEELKSTKVYNGFAQLGFENDHYESSFSTPVLTYMGFKEIDDDLLELYMRLMDKYCKKIEAGKLVSKYAMKIYIELSIAKKERYHEI